MPPQISFVSKHKSISALANTELPDFCLVTGKNGSGKSHFLEAIENGSVMSDYANGVYQISRFTWETLSPKDQEAATPGQLNAIGEQIKGHLSDISKSQHPYITLNRGNRREKVNALQFISISREENLSDEDKDHLIDALMKIMAQVFASSQSIENLRGRLYISAMNKDLLFRDIPVLLGTNEALRHNAILAFDQIVPQGFEQELNKVFQRYRDQTINNLIAEKEGLSEEIVVQQVPTPWDFLNNILDDGHINFRVEKPPHHPTTSNVVVQLKKIGTNEPINFADLSSGEKIFISFAIALYNTEGKAEFPKLLLLDEIDATLHPSMVKYVLHVIKETLVEKLGIKVIMTTHSPTTVALVEDTEVYEMDNVAGALKPIGRSKALQILTEGIPTLAIDYDARILVITESDKDARIWGSLYTGLRSKLSSEKTLSFIGCGLSKKGQADSATGCDVVKKLVETMREEGIKRVAGLIDWDKKNTEAGSIFVHSFDERYSLENLLLDPVLLIMILAKRNPKGARDAGLLGKNESDKALDKLEDAEWQRRIDILCATIVEIKDLITISYQNGKVFNIPKAFLEMNGHVLETEILKKIPAFRQVGNTLTEPIADEISRDGLGEYYPASIVKLFEKISEFEYSVSINQKKCPPKAGKFGMKFSYRFI